MEPEISVSSHKRVLFFTGAGMSVESGIPTYRGRGGVWREYNYEEYACQEAFEQDPDRVWEFHEKRRAAIGACEPNPGHRLIAGLEGGAPSVTVVTQNIDGLHQRAGSVDVLELHGCIWRVRCGPCGTVVPNTEIPMETHRCECGAHLRPDIVWFGDPLNGEVITTAEEAIRGCDLLVSIGTSAVVFPAAQLPLLARAGGATLVEINPEETQLSHLFDVKLRGPASEMLERICR